MKIGFCNGCFDVLHEGHKYFIREARNACSYLLIGINSDLAIRQAKGSGRPIQKLEARMQAIAEFVNSERLAPVALLPFEGNDRALIHCVRPQVIVKSEQYRHEGYWDIFRGHGELSIVWIPRREELGSTTTNLNGGERP